MRLVIGSVLAALGMFVWGFIFWGLTLSDPFSHASAKAESAILKTLSANLTEDGTYLLPDSKNGTMEEATARIATGPFVQIYYHASGVKMGDPKTMGLGFIHMLICCFLLGLILQKAVPAVPGYFDRLRYATLIGLLAAVFTQLGNPIWWHHTWHTAIRYAEYDVVAYIIAGAILAKFTRPAA